MQTKRKNETVEGKHLSPFRILDSKDVEHSEEYDVKSGWRGGAGRAGRGAGRSEQIRPPSRYEEQCVKQGEARASRPPIYYRLPPQPPRTLITRA